VKKIYLSENIKHLRAEKNITLEQLASELDINTSKLKSYEYGIRQNPDIHFLVRISQFFQINLDYLLLVNIGKLNVDQRNLLKEGKELHVKGTQLRILTTSVNNENEENIELVPLKAIAGYTSGYADVEYISELPVFNLPFLSKNKKFRAFEITGDSMYPIKTGSVVIGEYITDWTDIKNGTACVVLTVDDGVVFKIVDNEISSKRSLLLQSLNELYKPYSVKVENILEVWKFVTYMSKEIPEPVSVQGLVFQKLKDIESRLGN